MSSRQGVSCSINIYSKAYSIFDASSGKINTRVVALAVPGVVKVESQVS